MHGLNYPPDIPRLGPQKPLRQPKRKFWLGQICTKCRPVHVAASGSTNPSAHGQLGPAAAAENPAKKAEQSRTVELSLNRLTKETSLTLLDMVHSANVCFHTRLCRQMRMQHTWYTVCGIRTLRYMHSPHTEMHILRLHLHL